ncbi:MAG: hypothetical protein WCR70_04305 [Sphaerochaetaceae bacterium]
MKNREHTPEPFKDTYLIPEEPRTLEDYYDIIMKGEKESLEEAKKEGLTQVSALRYIQRTTGCLKGKRYGWVMASAVYFDIKEEDKDYSMQLLRESENRD